MKLASDAAHAIPEVVAGLPRQVAEALLHDLVELREDMERVDRRSATCVVHRSVHVQAPLVLDLIDRDVDVRRGGRHRTR